MTMPGSRTPRRPQAPENQGKARASLVLGLLGLPALLLCGLGLPLALTGLVLGTVAALRQDARGTALAGVAASTVTVIVATVGVVWMLNQAAECGNRARYPDDAATRGCIEREFPFAQRTPSP